MRRLAARATGVRRRRRPAAADHTTAAPGWSHARFGACVLPFPITDPAVTDPDAPITQLTRWNAVFGLKPELPYGGLFCANYPPLSPQFRGYAPRERSLEEKAAHTRPSRLLRYAAARRWLQIRIGSGKNEDSRSNYFHRRIYYVKVVTSRLNYGWVTINAIFNRLMRWGALAETRTASGSVLSLRERWRRWDFADSAALAWREVRFEQPLARARAARVAALEARVLGLEKRLLAIERGRAHASRKRRRDF